MPATRSPATGWWSHSTSNAASSRADRSASAGCSIRPRRGHPARHRRRIMSAERGHGPSSVLRAEAITKRLGGRDILAGVTVEVRAGEVVGLLGPNGAGKTTTFYCLVG